MAIWAAGFPAAELLLASWDPLAVVPLRFLFALLLLLPLWLALEGRPRGLPWGPALAAGGLGIGGGAVTLILAQALTDPVTVAVIASVSPLTGTLVERMAARGRAAPLSRAFLLGLAASVAGGVVATAGAGTAGGASLLAGGGLAALSCLLYSWGSHECVRALPGRSAAAQTTVSVLGAFGATALAAAGAAALGLSGLPEAVGGRDVGLLAVYGMGGMAVSQLLFILGVRRIGIALASFHTNAAPFYVMLMMLGLGGGWSWAQAAGAAIVAAGVLLAQRR
jgi:drug/metabolite transporter (DMT)-like permease